MKHLVSLPAGFFIAAIILHRSGALATLSHTLINGPEPWPMTVVAPLGAMVTFTCVVNTTELPAGTTLVGINTDGLINWIVNGKVLEGSNQSVIGNGALRIGTRQLPVIQDYLTTGVPVQCEIVVRVSSTEFIPFSSNNATLTAYGD